MVIVLGSWALDWRGSDEWTLRPPANTYIGSTDLAIFAIERVLRRPRPTAEQAEALRKALARADRDARRRARMVRRRMKGRTAVTRQPINPGRGVAMEAPRVPSNP
jgi:hypothetical protein